GGGGGRGGRGGRSRPCGLRLEHFQHAVGDDESTDDVQRCEHHGEKPEGELGRPVRLAEDDHRAHEDDAVDGVAPRHQRCVEDARYLRDDLVPDERGEDEHRDEAHEPGTGGGDHDGASLPSSSWTVGSWTTSPFRMTQLCATISSSK